MLGGAVQLAGTPSHWFRQTLHADRPWFISQHRLLGTPVLPGAAMVEWVLAAARSADGHPGPEWTLEGVTFNELMRFPDNQPITVQAVVEPARDALRVHCFGRTTDQRAGVWTEHVTATTATPTAPPRPEPVDPEQMCVAMVSQPIEALYPRLWRVGIEYGSAFQGLKRLWRLDEEAVAFVEVTEAAEDGTAYLLHPVVLDACFQVVPAFAEGEDATWLPVQIDRISVYDRLPTRLWCHARWRGLQSPTDCAVDLSLLSESGDRLVTIEGLHLRQLPSAALAGLAAAPMRRYELSWLPIAGRPARGVADLPARTWLVCSPEPALTRQWREQLDAIGMPAIGVVLDSAGDAADPDMRYVDASAPADVERLFVQLREQGGRIGGLVLHGGDAASPSGRDPDCVLDSTYRLAQRCFVVVQQFLRATAADHPDVVLCSTGAIQPTPDTAPPDLVQTPLTGLTKAIITEYPSLKCVQVDLDPSRPVPPVLSVLERAADLPGAGHLAQRDETWYEARLREDSLAHDRAAPPIRSDGTYLITGGLGGIGLAVASWLADRGARTLVLCGRTVPDEEPAAVAELRARGVRVELVQTDVANPVAVQRMLDRAGQELPPLHGLVHAAGITDDDSLEGLDWARFARVMDPKVSGAWQLHRATAHLDLDFFVVFSSAAALLGSPGQANYVTANAFLDALAAYRVHAGQPGLSVAWGPWSEVGMAAQRGLLDRFGRMGLDTIGQDEALSALSVVLADSTQHVGLAKVQWRRFLAVAGRRQPYTLFTDVTPASLDDFSPTTPERVEELIRLSIHDPDAARAAMLSELLDRVALLFGMTAADRDALHPTFGRVRLNELGLDSLTTVRLRNQLLADFSVDVPPKHLFGGSTATDIADLICEQLAVRTVLTNDDDPLVDDEAAEVLTL